VRGKGREDINLQIYYPILVTAGALDECFVGSGRPRYRRVHRIGLVHRRIHAGSARDERIDVVDVVGLRSLLGVIERDVIELSARLRRSQVALERALTTITPRLSRMEPSMRREVLAGFADKI
jgi:hypothetical protein